MSSQKQNLEDREGGLKWTISYYGRADLGCDNPAMANNMASFRDVLVMADDSLEGEKSSGEDVPIASWSEK